MVDAVGSLFQFYRTPGPLLEQSAAQLRRFHPWHWRKPLCYNRRDHRKLLVVDGEIAFLGGFNIHRQSSQRYYGAARWRDTQASFQGELARQAAGLHLRRFFWQRGTEYLRGNAVLRARSQHPESAACGG